MRGKNRFWIWNVLLGFTIWLGVTGFLLTDVVEKLLCFSFLVTVPLALDVAGVRVKALRIWHLVAALFAVGAFLLPAGEYAGLLAVPWLLGTAGVAVCGLVRFLRRGLWFVEEVAIDVALMYLVLGGVWFLVERAGWNLLGFGGLTALLTAGHFHNASLAAPLFAGLLGRVLRRSRGELTKGYRWLLIGMMVSPMLVAIGITYSRVIEFGSVALFVLLLLVYTVKCWAVRVERRGGKWLLVLSSSSLFVTMTAALLYGFQRMTNIPLITLEQMVYVHAVVNVFGFVLLGLIAWRMIQPAPSKEWREIPHSRIFGAGRIGADFLERRGLVEEGRQVKGLVDEMHAFRRDDFAVERLHPRVRDFYEDTLSYQLIAKTKWSRGFRTLSKVYKGVAKRVQQINLPLHEEGDAPMAGRLVAVRGEHDEREAVRAWVRTYEEGEDTAFVALYSWHEHEGERYMNIALPLPFSSMTGVLRLDIENYETTAGDAPENKTGVLTLTSLPRPMRQGDEGIYLFMKRFAMRLPIDEHFRVWAGEADQTLYARHRMWMFGISFLTIDYEIVHRPRADWA